MLGSIRINNIFGFKTVLGHYGLEIVRTLIKVFESWELEVSQWSTCFRLALSIRSEAKFQVQHICVADVQPRGIWKCNLLGPFLGYQHGPI